MKQLLVGMPDEMHDDLLLAGRFLNKSGSQLVREGIELRLAPVRPKLEHFKAELEKED